MKNVIIAALCIILVFLCYFKLSFAGELKITQIETVNNSGYDITINNSISVHNVVLKNEGGKNAVEFPVYAADGKVYKQFSVLRRDYNEYLISSLKENKKSDYAAAPDFKINKFSKLKKEGNIKAFASVIFEDRLEVECRIMDGKNGFWVAWPANKKEGVWKPDFSFADKNLKKRVEEALILKYNKENERK